MANPIWKLFERKNYKSPVKAVAEAFLKIKCQRSVNQVKEKSKQITPKQP